MSGFHWRPSELDHHLDGFAVIHRAVAIGNTVDVRDAIEDEARLDSAFQHAGHELVHVGANRRRTAGDCDVAVERRLRIRDRGLLRNADAADGAAGTRDAHGRAHRLTVPDAFEDGMGAEPTGQLAYPLDRSVPTLADDISRPELAGQGDAVVVTAEHDDLLRTETTGGDDRAEPHSTITNDSSNFSRSHIRP